MCGRESALFIGACSMGGVCFMAVLQNVFLLEKVVRNTKRSREGRPLLLYSLVRRRGLIGFASLILGDGLRTVRVVFGKIDEMGGE